MSGLIDQAQVHARAGDGGAGAVSFRREAGQARGGPDGGDGGRGGDVWLVASHRVASLAGFARQPYRRAADGGHGRGRLRHGAAGAPAEVEVPVGTLVRRLDGEVVADLARPGQRFLAARGGRGGRGNARFATSRRRAPAFAEQGERGQDVWLDLELKLVADVALVGLPNAGKSSLLARISAARPKVAAYPFTTLEPHLGVARAGDRELVVADVPGLVEGASRGRGLGHRFLRHVERARVLVLLVDLSAEADPASQERVLVGELGSHDPGLLSRPRLVVGSKADAARWAAGPLACSAVTGGGLDQVVAAMAGALDQAGGQAPPEAEVVLRPEPEGVWVQRYPGGGFVVRGEAAERAVALSDLTDPGALEHVRRRLGRLGVDRALARAGARAGDPVRVGELSFVFEPDGRA
jgi:GTP-binding protein